MRFIRRRAHCRRFQWHDTGGSTLFAPGFAPDKGSWPRLERGDHGCRQSCYGDVLWTITDRETHNLLTILDRDDRQVIAACVGDKTQASVVRGFRPTWSIANRHG